MNASDFPESWRPALTHSRFLRQLLTANPDLADWVREHAGAALSSRRMRDFLAAETIADEDGEKRALRRLRQRVMAVLMVRDLGGQAPLAEVFETMSALAEVVANHALGFLHRRLAAQFGEPLDRQGRPQRLLVIGMGKLGGRELNVSSDVDYIFIYPEDGETADTPDGGKRIGAFDFFTRLGKRLIAAIGEITSDGQVFRVDMRLRPNGDSGALVGSIASLEYYFVAQGREWERYAWIKARVVNEGDNLQTEWVAALDRTVRPFVYRKYLDFGAINAMRELHAQIRREVARKDRAEHIKLGHGGIREIEFMAQVFQLIRGGRDAALRVRPTLAVLPLLTARRLLTTDGERELAEAYVFLRRLEHRLQYVDDAQTHSLPTDAAQREQIARSMDFADEPSMLAALAAHRQRVARHFDEIFSSPGDGAHALAGLWFEQIDGDDAQEAVSRLGFAHPAAMLERLSAFRRSARYQQLDAPIRERLDAIGPRLIEAAAATSDPDATWQRGLDLIETIGRRGAYFALLQQHPQALRKLAEIIGSSVWAAHYLTRHPILLDEVIDPRLYDVATDWEGFERDLRARLRSESGDTEREMDILREEHHAQVFRLLAQDIAGLQTVERLADHLTRLADIVVQTTLDLCWKRLRQRHPHPDEPPRFAVIAYGKLGGKELGYGSDLDLVFLHDDPDPGAGELYARLVQRMNTWLSSQTPAGQLFETDFRLRPNGDAGLMVCPVDAFREYQWSNAWVWEYQALTRARFCAGDPSVGRRFEAIRTEILRRRRDLERLGNEVREMRQRMLEAHASHSEEVFDIKQDPGGLVDVEFIVQFLVLGHAHNHAQLCGNLGNIALLDIAAGLDLIPRELAGRVRDIYRQYRRLQHAFRLDGSRTSRVPRAPYREDIETVRSLWERVFHGAGK